MNDRKDVIEIDVMELLLILWHWIWLIILCGFLVGAAAFGISKFILPEKYQSTTTVYVLSRTNENSVTYTDLQTGTQLTKDYTQMIQSRYVLEQVIEQLGLTDSYEKLYKRVNVSTPTDTRMINITVTDYSPVVAKNIADAIREAASEHIVNVMDIEAVNVVDAANLPLKPSSPNVMKWTLLGMLAGVFVCCAVILINYLMDDSIKMSEDIKNYLNLSTLALIPVSETAEQDFSGTHHHRNKEKTGGKR